MANESSPIFRLNKNFNFNFEFDEKSNVFEGKIDLLYENDDQVIMYRKRENEKKIEIFHKQFENIIKIINYPPLNKLYETILKNDSLEFSNFYKRFMNLLHDIIYINLIDQKTKIKSLNKKRKINMTDFMQLDENMLIKVDPNFLIFLTD
jgi:hypothetical protein